MNVATMISSAGESSIAAILELSKPDG
jgi:hypothetical protein